MNQPRPQNPHDTEPQTPRELSTTEIVFRTVQELRAQGVDATRHTISRACRLKLTIVDDRLRYLVDEAQRLYRTIRGCYELTQRYPEPRLQSISMLGDGCVKVEIGDVIFTLIPEEARNLARGLGGFADDLRMLESLRLVEQVAAGASVVFSGLHRADIHGKLRQQIRFANANAKALAKINHQLRPSAAKTPIKDRAMRKKSAEQPAAQFSLI